MSRLLRDPRAQSDMAGTAAVTVRHIRFAPEPAAGESVRRRYSLPRQVAAVEESSELGELPMDQSWPEAFDDLFVILAPTPLPLGLQKMVDLWLSPPGHPDSPWTVVVKLESSTIRWRPGRAVLEYSEAASSAARKESLLAALTGFAFFESELRRLEQDLLPHEASAPGDAAFAYQIRQNSHAEWERLGRTMHALSLLRLTFARLEPVLATPPRFLDPEGRRAAARLAIRSGVPTRLESVGKRLEACEDLYEGAVDRISDFRWYRTGEILEITIVVLLVLEVILMAWQLLRRL
jgi:hypothetical protein